jgi:hypothetical protein
VLPLKSRDELPHILACLQWIFQTPEVNAQIFRLLEEKLLVGKKATGRPGLELWHILVLGLVRQGLNCDYDRLEHVANYDVLVRQILGLNPVQAPHEKRFYAKTLAENAGCVDAELLGRICGIVKEAGGGENWEWVKRVRKRNPLLNSPGKKLQIPNPNTQ